MRVVQAGKLYVPHIGGVESNMEVLSRNLMRFDSSLQLKIVCGQSSRGAGKSDLIDGVPVWRAATIGRWLSTPITLGFAKAIRDWQPDILHFHAPFPWGDVAGWNLFRQVPTVVTHHMDIVRQAILLTMYGPIYHRTLKVARRILATSTQMADSSPWLVRWRHKVEVVPLGIDIDYWESLASDTSSDTFMTSLDGPIVLFVGRLVYYKGLKTFIAAASKIRATIVIAGDGPMLDELRTQVANSVCRIVLVGKVTDSQLAKLYRAADVFVLPSESRAEAFGIVLLEAALHRLPLVTCDIGTGGSHINIHGKTGLVVPPCNPDGLAAAVNQLLETVSMRKDYGEAGRERVQSLFSATTMAKRVRQVYDCIR